MFLCDLATVAVILQLSEADVWCLVDSRRVHPIGRTSDGRLIFDGVTVKPLVRTVWKIGTQASHTAKHATDY